MTYLIMQLLTGKNQLRRSLHLVLGWCIDATYECGEEEETTHRFFFDCPLLWEDASACLELPVVENDIKADTILPPFTLTYFSSSNERLRALQHFVKSTNRFLAYTIARE